MIDILSPKSSLFSSFNFFIILLFETSNSLGSISIFELIDSL